MKHSKFSFQKMAALLGLAATALFTGCATTSDSTTTATPAANGAPVVQMPNRMKTDDGRTIELGKATASGGGLNYKNPHLDKCWVADGFDFNGYDTIYIAPTLSTAKFDTKNAEEVKVHDIAKESLVTEFTRALKSKNLFKNVVTREADIKPGAKTLKVENTITEFAKGGGAARYFVGLYGGGQPVLRVQGKMTEGDKSLFVYEARRSGTSAGSRLGGVFMKDEDIQNEDVHSMVLDLTDFMSGRAGKYTVIK